MGSNVPPMTPTRLGLPTAGLYERKSGLRGMCAFAGGGSARAASKLLGPLPQPREMLFVVLRSRLHEPFLGERSHLWRRIELAQHAGASGPQLCPHHREWQVAVGFIERLVHRVDVQVGLAIGVVTELLEDLR